MIPSGPTALYRLFGEGDVLLYIGISNSFGRRWHQHEQAKPWWHKVRRQTIDWCPSREEAEAAEEAAIKAERPRYNVVHNTGSTRPSSRPTVPAPARRAWRTPGGPMPLLRRLSREDLDRMLPLAVLGGLALPEWQAKAREAVPGAAEFAHEFALEFLDCYGAGTCTLTSMIGETRGAEAECADDPAVVACCRRVRRSSYALAGMSCPLCTGAPRPGAVCLECGAEGWTAKVRTLASLARRDLAIPRERGAA